MSQSKLSGTDDKKIFVIKHSFDDPRNLKEGETVDGPIEYHFNIPWKLGVSKTRNYLQGYLDCLMTTEPNDWSNDMRITRKFFKQNGTEESVIYNTRITPGQKSASYFMHKLNIREYVINGKFTFEFSVQINEMTGVLERKKLRSFDDEAAKKFSDVVLVVGDQKFYVQKAYLATHCSYFEALFFGKFSEATKSEIELKEIDPDDFQHFLELIYGESTTEAHSVLGILDIAHFSDSKTVIRRCQEFLLNQSELSLKEKFEAAIKYDLKELQTKCLSEMKTVDDLRSIVPENPKDFDHGIWKELFMKLLSMK